jgi:hypothetical protein
MVCDGVLVANIAGNFGSDRIDILQRACRCNDMEFGRRFWRGEAGSIASAGFTARRAAMIRVLPGTSRLIVMGVAEDILKIEFAED